MTAVSQDFYKTCVILIIFFSAFSAAPLMKKTTIIEKIEADLQYKLTSKFYFSWLLTVLKLLLVIGFKFIPRHFINLFQL